MPRRKKGNINRFPFSRNDINIDLSSRASLEDRILQPGESSSGAIDDDSGSTFTPVVGLSIVPDANGDYDGEPVLQPDGTYRISVTIQWTDQAGAEEYEIWVSEAT